MKDNTFFRKLCCSLFRFFRMISIILKGQNDSSDSTNQSDKSKD